MKHAIVKIGDLEIPLIGIPESATLAACDYCHGIFYLTDVELNREGNQFLCLRCRLDVNENPRD